VSPQNVVAGNRTPVTMLLRDLHFTGLFRFGFVKAISLIVILLSQ
jgi:hypothetical protein